MARITLQHGMTSAVNVKHVDVAANRVNKAIVTHTMQRFENETDEKLPTDYCLLMTS